MSQKSIVLIGGGVRCGKSRFALERALILGKPGARRIFVATAQAFDDEMRARIEAHQRERKDKRGEDRFETIEEPLKLPELIQSLGDGELGLVAGDVVLVDCLTLWMSNVLLDGDAPREALDARAAAATKALCSASENAPFDLIFVTNEVGMGLVPPNELGRIFRDCVGRLHQELGALAGEVHLATLGRILRILPGPVEVVS